MPSASFTSSICSTIVGDREVIATGEEPSAAEVDRMLAETNKSITDLKNDVEDYQRRFCFVGRRRIATEALAGVRTGPKVNRGSRSRTGRIRSPAR